MTSESRGFLSYIQVLLQRLTWQRQPIWTLSPPSEDEGKEVRALAWRPDGKGKFNISRVSRERLELKLV